MFQSKDYDNRWKNEEDNSIKWTSTSVLDLWQIWLQISKDHWKTQKLLQIIFPLSFCGNHNWTFENVAKMEPYQKSGKVRHFCVGVVKKVTQPYHYIGRVCHFSGNLTKILATIPNSWKGLYCSSWKILGLNFFASENCYYICCSFVFETIPKTNLFLMGKTTLLSYYTVVSAN